MVGEGGWGVVLVCHGYGLLASGKRVCMVSVKRVYTVCMVRVVFKSEHCF